MITRVFEVITCIGTVAWYGQWPRARDPWLSQLVSRGAVTLVKLKNGQRYTAALDAKGKLLFYKEKQAC